MEEEISKTCIPLFKRWGLWCALTLCAVGALLCGYQLIYLPNVAAAYESGKEEGYQDGLKDGYADGVILQAETVEELRDEAKESEAAHAALLREYNRNKDRVTWIYQQLRDVARSAGLSKIFPRGEKPTVESIFQDIDKLLQTDLESIYDAYS